MTMPPTITPRTTMSSGSMREVSASSSRLDFLVPEVGHLLEHGVDLAGRFAGADHADEHRREDRLPAQRRGEVIAFFDVAGRRF